MNPYEVLGVSENADEETIKNASICTVYNYYRDLILFFKYIKFIKKETNTNDKIENTDITDIDTKFLSSITYEEIEQYFFYLKSVKNNNAATRKRRVISLRNFFRFLDYKNINVSKEILDLPLVTPNWKGRMVPIVLSKEEQSKRRNHFDQQNGIGLRNYLIISLMMDYGLRCAEIPAITIDNIQWSTNDLIIRNTKNNNNRCIL